LRHLEAVTVIAAESGFAPPEIVMMPANNLCVIFRQTGFKKVGV
jgi:hypothetical protein